jgi:hypothetical protein
MSRPPRPLRPDDADHGQALSLVLIGVALLATIALAVASVGSHLAQRGAAQAAADAAALAGVDGGHAAAATLASRNGAAMVAFSAVADGSGRTVTVTVRVGDERATATASDEP